MAMPLRFVAFLAQNATNDCNPLLLPSTLPSFDTDQPGAQWFKPGGSV